MPFSFGTFIYMTAIQGSFKVLYIFSTLMGNKDLILTKKACIIFPHHFSFWYSCLLPTKATACMELEKLTVVEFDFCRRCKRRLCANVALCLLDGSTGCGRVCVPPSKQAAVHTQQRWLN